MKFSSLFITTFACVLNMALTSYVQNINPGDADARSNRIKREVSTAQQRNKCYEEFTIKNDALLAEIKHKSILCDKIEFNFRKVGARQALHSFVENKMRTIQNAVEECSNKINAAEYLQCVRDFGHSTRDYLGEIEHESEMCFKQLEEIENDERYCLRKIVDQSENNSAILDLLVCMEGNTDLTSTPPRSSNPSFQEDYKMNKYLKELKSVYSTIKNCTNNGKQRLAECLYDATHNNSKLEHYIRVELPPKFFKMLNDIDKAENTCLRHLSVQYLLETDFCHQFFYCLQVGRTQTSYFENINDDIIGRFKKLFKDVTDCRNYDDSSETKVCVDRWFSRTKTTNFEFVTILDEEIEQLVHTINVDDGVGSCMRHALKVLQFKGIFMDKSTREGFYNCFIN